MTVQDTEICYERRKIDVAKYIEINRITSLFSKLQEKHTFPDGMIDDYVQFIGKEKFLSFSCHLYPSKIEYRVEAYENNYHEWVFTKWNEE